MITAYLAVLPSYYENEDIEIRYRIYEDEELICKENIFKSYKKPSISELVGLQALLKPLREHDGKEITVIVNNGAINEQLEGTSQTKNNDIIRMSKIVKGDLDKFETQILIKNISGNNEELKKWDEISRP